MSGGPYLTEDEREIIRSLFVEHGAPLRFIAHAVGRHWRTVQNITVKLGQERLDHLKCVAGEMKRHHMETAE